jgi:NADH:ubiquinone oxidoreductase subunit 6 (subunit J)
MNGPRDTTKPQNAPDEAPRETREAKAIMALVVLAMMLFAIAESLAWHTTASRLDAFSEMARAVFTTYIVPFEILGFLLLAALLGALYIATREGYER